MKLRDASGEMLQYSHRKKNEEVTQKLELLRMTAAVWVNILVMEVTWEGSDPDFFVIEIVVFLWVSMEMRWPRDDPEALV